MTYFSNHGKSPNRFFQKSDEQDIKAAGLLMTLNSDERDSSDLHAGEESPRKKQRSTAVKHAIGGGNSSHGRVLRSSKDKAIPAEPSSLISQNTRSATKPKDDSVLDSSNPDSNLAPTLKFGPPKRIPPRERTSNNMTMQNTPRQRQAPALTPADPRPVPTCWEDADDTDRMVMNLRDAGRSWDDIRSVYKDTTGHTTQPRYDHTNCGHRTFCQFANISPKAPSRIATTASRIT